MQQPPAALTATDPDGLEWTRGFDLEDDSDGFLTQSVFAHREGRIEVLNWSRFRTYTNEHFTKFIEAGLIGKVAPVGNWFPIDIEEAHAKFMEGKTND